MQLSEVKRGVDDLAEFIGRCSFGQVIDLDPETVRETTHAEIKAKKDLTERAVHLFGTAVRQVYDDQRISYKSAKLMVMDDALVLSSVAEAKFRAFKDFIQTPPPIHMSA